jgi:hypothetical protein
MNKINVTKGSEDENEFDEDDEDDVDIHFSECHG